MEHKDKDRIPIKEFYERVQSGLIIECPEEFATTVSIRISKRGLTNGYIFGKSNEQGGSDD